MVWSGEVGDNVAGRLPYAYLQCIGKQGWALCVGCKCYDGTGVIVATLCINGVSRPNASVLFTAVYVRLICSF